MKTTLLVALVLLVGIANAAERVKAIYHTHKLGANVVGITCDNGADPTVMGNPTGGLLIVSCGK